MKPVQPQTRIDAIEGQGQVVLIVGARRGASLLAPRPCRFLPLPGGALDIWADLARLGELIPDGEGHPEDDQKRPEPIGRIDQPLIPR